MNSATISWKLRLFMKVFKFMVFDCKIIMNLNTVPTNYHEFEYSKFAVFKLKFMTTGRIHAERCSSRAPLRAKLLNFAGSPNHS